MELNLETLWQQTLEEIEKSGQFDPATFAGWIRPSSLFRIDQKTAYVSYTSLISRKMLEKKKDLFESVLSQLAGEDLKILFIDQKEMEKMMPELQVASKTSLILSQPFEPSYTFDSFVEGSSNAEAYAACLNCCNQNTPLFNPLMLFGNSGLGKTHLLHAVGNYLHQEKPEKKVIYTYSGNLVTILIEAMKTKNLMGNTVERVKEALMDCDYFLIDDIQNLKHQGSQEVFFTVYNALIQKGAQIIITSDIHPHELNVLQQRLVSRFSQGLTVNISTPEFETSKAILNKKIEGHQESIAIQEDVLDYMASQFSNDVRNLEGKLNKLIFSSIIYKQDVIDLEFARSVLCKDAEVEKTGGEITPKDIKKAVTRYYNLTYKDLEGKSRQKQIAVARHACVYLCRQILQIPYAAIGKELGNRDHTTISSSYERAVSLLARDEAFCQAVDKIRESLE